MFVFLYIKIIYIIILFPTLLIFNFHFFCPLTFHYSFIIPPTPVDCNISIIARHTFIFWSLCSKCFHLYGPALCLCTSVFNQCIKKIFLSFYAKIAFTTKIKVWINYYYYLLIYNYSKKFWH